MFSLIRAWRNVWVNNREAGDLRPQHAQYDVTVMLNGIIIDNVEKYEYHNEEFRDIITKVVLSYFEPYIEHNLA